MFLGLCKLIENIIYLPFKLFKTQRKITFITRQFNSTTLEFQMIIDALKDDNIKIVSIAKKLEANPISVLENILLFFKEMYHISTSKMLIVDGYCIMASTLMHKKNLIIVQTWHANGIIKKIGLQTLDSRSKFMKFVSLAMNMHENYDYVLSSSKESSKVFLEAFDIKEENLLEIGTPMLDYLYNKQNVIKDKMFNINKKPNVIYMPTLRKGKKLDMSDFFKNFNYDKYNLYVKLHPEYQDDTIDKRINVINKYTGEQIISVADYVITDYSNIMFEAGLCGKKVILYIPDIDEYKINPGLNVDVSKDFKYASSDAKEVVKMLDEDYDMDLLKAFCNKYVGNFDGKCVERIRDFILKKIN